MLSFAIDMTWKTISSTWNDGIYEENSLLFYALCTEDNNPTKMILLPEESTIEGVVQKIITKTIDESYHHPSYAVFKRAVILLSTLDPELFKNLSDNLELFKSSSEELEESENSSYFGEEFTDDPNENSDEQDLKERDMYKGYHPWAKSS